MAAINTASANWRSFSIDNLSYALVPEPSGAMLLMVGAMGFGIFATTRRFRERKA